MPQKRIDFTQPSDFLKPYPDPKDVFVPEQVGLARHLHPLVSIDLSIANSAWSGWAHILSPLEPVDGLPFQSTGAFHDDFLKTNALILRLKNGRYRFPGDMRAFLLEQERESLDPDEICEFDQIVAEYEIAERSYQGASALYHKHGRLHFVDAAGEIKKNYSDKPEPFLEQIGGNAPYGNWTGTLEYDFDTTWKEGDPYGHPVWPLSFAGRRFEFVASTPGWNYRYSGADSILLFYEPVESLVMLTFDWT